MPVCAVASCKSVHRKGSLPSFFCFPSEPALRDKWAAVCKRADKFNPNTSRICSEHFRKEDYDSSYLLRQQLCPDLLSVPRLKKDAAPSLNLPSALITDVSIKRKFGRGKGKQKKRLRSVARIEVIEFNDQPLPVTTTENDRDTSKDGGSKAAREEVPQEARSAPDDVAEWRRRSKQLRRERHERKERKELVEQLLAEHDKNQQKEAAAAAAAAETEAGVQVIVLNPGDDTRKKGGDSEAEAEVDVPSDSSAAGDPAGDSQPLPGAGGVRHSGLSVAAVRGRPLGKRPSLMVERTKEILQLKLRVRKLEAKCLRVLGVTDAPSPDTGGGGEGRGAADEGEGQAENPERRQVDPAPAAGESLMPLVVLRDEKLPAILTQLRQSRQSDGLSTLTPSGLREAQEINHQLKVQMLSLQASVLKWVIKNKRLRDARLRKAREGGEKRQRTVRAVRLRELLGLESAVKAMFSEAQIRAMTRQHGDDSIPPSKRKGAPHWSEQDLRRVLELRAISSDKVVEHVRDKMKIPLPSMQTTRKRCYKSPELNDVYREIMQKNEDSRKLCAMCERQVTTIDQVIEAAADELPDDNATYGHQFVQHVPSPSPPRSTEEPAALPRPKKRRRAPATTPSRTRKKVWTSAATSHDWVETDSDAELSDPGLWDRLGSNVLAAVPGELRGRPDGHLRRQPPDPYRGPRKSWR